MADLDDVVGRLDRLSALLTVGLTDQLDRIRQQLAAAPLDSAILAAVAEDWVLSGELQRRVSKQQKVSERTVRAALTELTRRHLILVRGSGHLTSYKSSGLL